MITRPRPPARHGHRRQVGAVGRSAVAAELGPPPQPGRVFVVGVLLDPVRAQRPARQRELGRGERPRHHGRVADRHKRPPPEPVQTDPVGATRPAADPAGRRPTEPRRRRPRPRRTAARTTRWRPRPRPTRPTAGGPERVRSHCARRRPYANPDKSVARRRRNARIPSGSYMIIVSAKTSPTDRRGSPNSQTKDPRQQLPVQAGAGDLAHRHVPPPRHPTLKRQPAPQAEHPLGRRPPLSPGHQAPREVADAESGDEQREPEEPGGGHLTTAREPDARRRCPPSCSIGVHITTVRRAQAMG